MKKLYTNNDWKKYNSKRSQLALKKLTKNGGVNKSLKKKKLYDKLIKFQDKLEQRTFALLPAPPEFNFIDNTDSVLSYLKDAEKYFRQGRGVTFDKSNVTDLSSDAIALFIAFLSGKNARFRGNAPTKEDLKELFEESGFYNYVKAPKRVKQKTNVAKNLLHKESHNTVTTDIAEDAVMRGLNHTGINPKTTDPVYDTLIECMQNTNNHASLNKYGNCNWWLYVYNDPKEKITKYSFVDLGVGIFKSLVANGYLKKILKGISVLPNISLVEDLLDGKIQSRIEEDNEIRGKGIPQIVDYSKMSIFKRFFIIANDVKINVKTGEKWQLQHNMNGTFLYWELHNN